MLSIIGGTVTLCTENGTPLSQQHAFQAIYKWYMFWAEGLYCVDHIYLHWITASSIDWLIGASLHSPTEQSEMLGGCQDRVSWQYWRSPSRSLQMTTVQNFSFCNQQFQLDNKAKLWSRDKPNPSQGNKVLNSPRLFSQGIFHQSDSLSHPLYR